MCDYRVYEMVIPQADFVAVVFRLMNAGWTMFLSVEADRHVCLQDGIPILSTGKARINWQTMGFQWNADAAIDFAICIENCTAEVHEAMIQLLTELYEQSDEPTGVCMTWRDDEAPLYSRFRFVSRLVNSVSREMLNQTGTLLRECRAQSQQQTMELLEAQEAQLRDQYFLG